MSSLPVSSSCLPRHRPTHRASVSWRMSDGGRWTQVAADSPPSSASASASLSCKAGESTTAASASAEPRRRSPRADTAATTADAALGPAQGGAMCDLCAPVLSHTAAHCPFACEPAREPRDAVPWGSADFVPLDRFLSALLAEESGDADWPLPFEDTELKGEALARARQVLLLTLPYHSAPVGLLRRVLQRLRAPPPPSPYEAASGVFGTEGEAAEEGGSACSRAEEIEAEDDVATSATPTQSRPSRSADVAIVLSSGNKPQSKLPAAAAHAQPIRRLQAQSQARGAFEDPLLCCSPTSSSASTSASTSVSMSMAHSLPSPSTSAPASATASEPSSASHTHTAASSIVTPSTSTDTANSATSQSVSTAVSSESKTRTLDLAVEVDVTASHMRTSTSTEAPLISAAPPSSRATARVAAFQQWHASKLHLLQLLHLWLISHPQDFCCLPYESSAALVSVRATAAGAPKRRPLGELLQAQLVAFPPKEWLRPAPWSSVGTVSAGGAPAAAAARRGPVALDAHSWQALRGAADALLRAYDQQLRGADAGTDILSPSSPSEPDDRSSAASAATAAAALSPLSLSTPTPTSPSPSPDGVAAGVGMSPLVLSPCSPPLRAVASSGSAASPSSQQRTQSPSTNSWSQSWGNIAVQRNLESSRKLQRMIMQQQQGEGRPSTAAASTTSSSTGPGSAATSGSAAASASASPRLTMVASPSQGPLVYAAAQAVQAKSTAELLAVAPRSYAAALTWLAIQRMQLIGNCAREDVPMQTAASQTLGSPALVAASSPTAAPGASRVSFHHPASFSSAGFLRLFLRMPSHLSRAQMRMSNTFSCFVATTVLRAPSVATRKQVVRHWIEVAQACLHQPIGGSAAAAEQPVPADAPLHNPNFMHAFEIIYGINHQSVYRLPAAQVGPDGRMPSLSTGGSIIGALSAVARRGGGGGAAGGGGSGGSQTLLPLLHKRNFLSPQSYEAYMRLTRLTSPNGNYREYRKALQAAQDALPPEVSAPAPTSTPAPPVRAHAFFVPYLGILLKDLVGLEDAGKPLAGMACAALPPQEQEEKEGEGEGGERGQGDQAEDAAGDEARDQSRTRITRGSSAGPSARPSMAESTRTASSSSATAAASASAPDSPSIAPNDHSVGSAAAAAALSSSPEDESDSRDSSMPPPTGSLPWDDSFLSRPRRNATLVMRRDDSRWGSSGSVLSQLMEESEEDVFASSSSAPEAHHDVGNISAAPHHTVASATATAPRPSTSAPHNGSGSLVPPPGGLAPSSSAQTDVRRKTARDNLLQMLTEGTTDEAEPFPKLPPAATSAAGADRRPTVSLLSAALPARNANGSLSLLAAAATASPTTSSASPSHSRTASADRRNPAPSHAPPPPACLLVNYSKLSKVSAITSATLRCRFFLPQLPTEEEDEIEQSRATATASDANAKASPPQPDAASAFADLLAQAALSSSAGAELRAAVIPAPPSQASSKPVGSRLSALPFDRRVQHWLVSNMLTLTLQEEAQLMELSYQLFPRKQAAAAASRTH